MQAGVVRLSERHLHTRPARPRRGRRARRGLPRDARGRRCRATRRAACGPARASPARRRRPPAIELGLEPYDPSRVHGHVLEPGDARGAARVPRAMPLERRREVPGLHPDRAPTIVAGVAMLMECLRAFDLERGGGVRARHPARRRARARGARGPSAKPVAPASAKQMPSVRAKPVATGLRRSRMPSVCAKPVARSPFLGIAFAAPPAETCHVGSGDSFLRARHHRSGRSRMFRRLPPSGPPENGPVSARTPARPDGASLEAASGRLPAVQDRDAISRTASATASGASTGRKWPTSSSTRTSTSSKSRSILSVHAAANSGSRVGHSAMTGRRLRRVLGDRGLARRARAGAVPGDAGPRRRPVARTRGRGRRAGRGGGCRGRPPSGARSARGTPARRAGRRR